MAVVKQHKVVASLPDPLEADSIYYVRAGDGVDVYVTNGAGMVVAYPVNYVTPAELNAAIGDIAAALDAINGTA